MKRIVSQLKPAKILVIGDVMVDRYWWGTVDRISPEAPVPVVSVDDVSLVAGGAANVAANVQGLGSKAVVVGIAGDDAECDLLATALQRSGLNDVELHRIPGRKTTVKNRVVAHNQQMLRFDHETSSALTAEEVSGMAFAITNALAECEVVVLSDYGKGFLTPELLRIVISEARRLGRPVLVDPKGQDYSKYTGATVVTPNQKEAEQACGLPLCDDTVDAAGYKLLKELDLQGVVITRGERGMRVYETSGVVSDLPASARMVYNVTGAGDTVIASLAVGLANGLPLSDSARLANFAAGLVVENVGTTAIQLSMLLEHEEQIATAP